MTGKEDISIVLKTPNGTFYKVTIDKNDALATTTI